MSEYRNNEYIESVSNDGLLISEATPSKPEAEPEKIPPASRGRFISSSYCVTPEKKPLWVNIVFTLVLLFFMILCGLYQAAQGPCPERHSFRGRRAVFCAIGQAILKHDRRSIKTLDSTSYTPSWTQSQ